MIIMSAELLLSAFVKFYQYPQHVVELTIVTAMNPLVCMINHMCPMHKLARTISSRRKDLKTGTTHQAHAYLSGVYYLPDHFSHFANTRELEHV